MSPSDSGLEVEVGKQEWQLDPTSDSDNKQSKFGETGKAPSDLSRGHTSGVMITPQLKSPLRL